MAVRVFFHPSSGVEAELALHLKQRERRVLRGINMQRQWRQQGLTEAQQKIMFARRGVKCRTRPTLEYTPQK